MAQSRAFAGEISSLGSANKKVAKVKWKNKLYSLDPSVDEGQVLHVGGRLKNSSLSNSCTYPILFPKNGTVTELLIRWCHEKTAHRGRDITLSEIRSNWYWIIDANSKTRQIIFKCVTCRSLHGRLGEQKMANLPCERTTEAPPFTYCSIDMFGSFYIKEKRSEFKRYGAMFVCLASRAVHIEVTHQINNDSFIQALQRIIARRGNVRLMQSDNGSNFLGTENELKRAFLEMDNKKISHFFKTKVQIGLNGKEINLQPVTCVVSGNDKFDLQDQFSYHYWRLKVKV